MKSLFKNSIYNIIYRFFSLVFPLLSSVYVSRVLMPTGVGRVAYAQNIVSYFITFAGLGITSYGIREIGKTQHDKEKYSKVFVELFLVTFISTLICSIIYYTGIIFLIPFTNEKSLYLVAGFQLILSAFNVDWFYQGIEEYKYITSRSMIIKIITLAAMFLYIKSEGDVVKYALLSSMALAGNNIINVIHIRKYIGSVQFSSLNLKKHIKPLIILLATGLAVELYTKLDTTTLGILTYDINVGYYNYATKITSIVINLTTALSIILLPRLGLYYEKNRFTELNRIIEVAHKALISISLPATIGLFLIANEIVVFLFGQAFIPTIATVKILSLLIVIKSLGNLYGVQVLVTFGGEKLLFYTTIMGAISNILMNIALIPLFQQNGAAAASVVSELMVCIAQFMLAKRFIKFEFEFKLYVQVGISCLAMALVVLGIKMCMTNLLNIIILSCCLGGLTYYMCSILLRNEVIHILNHKIKKIISKTR